MTQDYENLKILVSDNASRDATREVIESYDDPRIRYINPGTRLGMSEHWEFALSHVEDGYVGVIGDDDGLLPDSASSAASLLHTSDADALVWPLAAYYWPHFVRRDLANHVSLRVPGHRELRWRPSADVLGAVSRFEAPYLELPSPYWGFVRTSTLDAVRKRSGKLVWSLTPDVYIGVAVASVTSRYLSSNVALSLSGSSQHSNGAHQGMASTSPEGESPGSIYLRENQTQFHESFDYSGSIPQAVAEALVQARDHLGHAVPSPDLVEMMNASLRHEHFLFNRHSQEAIISSLRGTARKNGLSTEFSEGLDRWTRSRRMLITRAGLENVLRGNPIHPCPENIANVFDASLMVGDMLRQVGGRGAAATNLRGRANKVRAAARMILRRSTAPTVSQVRQ